MHNGEEQLRGLTEDVVALRPEWTPAAVRSSLRQLHHVQGLDLNDTAAAARAAATDTNARTPVAITWPQYRPTPTPKPPAPQCQVCGLPRKRCRSMAAKAGDAHDWTPPGTPPPPPRDLHGLITNRHSATSNADR